MHPFYSGGDRGYCGRFAPSPSGPLHFGSLIAALGSYLDAKSHSGRWLVRIEDIDTPRVMPGAADDILRTLEAYGLEWDGEVVYQSRRHDLYHDTLNRLAGNEHLYYCRCSRRDIKASGGIYANSCRALGLTEKDTALRLIQAHPVYHYSDAVQGEVSIPRSLAEEDYIVKRRDGLYAYQLVVVVDDIEQGITHVVRGADLLEPTARQIGLFQELQASIPRYAHLPLAVAEPGFKLSKQNYAPAIDKKAPQGALFDAMRFLGMTPPDELKRQNVAAMLAWARENWRLESVPNVLEIQVLQSNNEQGASFVPVKAK